MKNFKKKQKVFGILILFVLAIIVPITYQNIQDIKKIDETNEFFRYGDIMIKNATLRPNGDNLTEWDSSVNHWTRINDEDEIYLYWEPEDSLHSEIFDMESIDIGSELVTKIEIHALGCQFSTIGPNVSVNLGGWIDNEDILSFSSVEPDEWTIVTFSNLEGTNEDLENLQIKLTSNENSGPPSNYGQLDTLYCVIFYTLVDIIVTPESGVNVPMGYYPATYGFENDLPGSVPKGWTDECSGENYVRTNYLTYGHAKTLHIYDGGASANDARSSNIIPDQTSGTIEFWFLTTLLSRNTYFYGYADGSTIGFRLTLNSYADIQTNKWYHFRIDFNCVTDTFDCYINGNLISNDAPFMNPVSAIKRLMVGTSVVLGSYMASHFDAFGYSWDNNYEIGSNQHEGLFISFKEREGASWTGYSLDGASNVTIEENDTIPMPASTPIAPHTLQIFWSDSFGTYASEIREFYINTYPKHIVTPEERMYTEAMEGYYHATYGFESEVSGTIDARDWEHIISSSGTINIVDSYKGHNKVYQLHDMASNGSPRVYTNFENRLYGTCELWVLSTDLGKYSQVLLNHDNGSTFIFRIMLLPGNYIRLYNGTGEDFLEDSSLGIIPADEWIHLRIDFRCAGAMPYMGLSEDSYTIYLNGVKSALEVSFGRTGYEINQLLYGYGYTPANYYTYLDAVGFSWDPNYEIGDNFEEDFLLSIEETDEADWMGYSLDGQIPITIYGNTTFPMPNDGTHTIQVFWENSYGFYSTEPVSFQLDTTIYRLEIEILSQEFTPDDFLLEFFVKDNLGLEIDFARIDAWWDGVNVSDHVDNLGSGIYQISLNPDTINFGDTPILFTITASAENYLDGEFEMDFIFDFDIYKLEIEILNQEFTPEGFSLDFFVKNHLGTGIDNAEIEICWDGTNVSDQIQNLGAGFYNISLIPIIINPGDPPILLNMTIKADGYLDTEFEMDITVDTESDDILFVELVNEEYSEDEFVIQILIKDIYDGSIDFATVNAWWNGVVVSGENIVNLGEGLYEITLDPITVAPDESPIPLRIVINADGYLEKEILDEIAVDPETISKGAPPIGDNGALMIILTIVIISVGSALVIITVGIVRVRRKRGTILNKRRSESK